MYIKGTVCFIPFRVHIVTWNVGSSIPPDDITSLFGPGVENGSTDMFVVGWECLKCCIVLFSYIPSIVVDELINLPLHSLWVFSFPCHFCHLALFVLVLKVFFYPSYSPLSFFLSASVLFSLFRLQEVNSMINKRLKDALFTDQWSDLCMDTLSRFGYVLVSMKSNI